MRIWLVIVPLAGMGVAAGLPWWWSMQSIRDERTAMEVLGRLAALQRDVREHAGGYVIDLATLGDGCADGSVPAAPDLVARAAAAGYRLELRAAHAAAETGRDCRGRSLATNYYASARPVPSETVAQRAYALTSDGITYLFYDGVPPREVDIARGLATRADAAEDFDIP